MWSLCPLREQPVAPAAASASKKPSSALRWKWQKVSASGRAPTPRSGASMVQLTPQRAVLFGGVEDEESEEALESLFRNDIFQLATDGHPPRWFSVDISQVSAAPKRRRKRKKAPDGATAEAGADDDGESGSSDSDDEDDDGEEDETSACATAASATSADVTESLEPIPRMNAALAVKSGTLYVYGGMYEQGDRQVFLDDMYSLEVGRRGGWKTLVPLRSDALPWLEKEEEEEDSEEEEDDDAAQAAADSSSDGNDDKVVDEPVVPTEKFGEFFIRTKERWMEEARGKLAREETAAVAAAEDSDDESDDFEVKVKKLAFRLAEMSFRSEGSGGQDCDSDD